ncbi:MAG: hypothetical protein A2051_07755 [Desulfovibrionales bacterium GWA2_65_9]|nr:MAG: hypothetical protein A2051_07755 [Desulfovibrionales bacterium GWA2_65_9]
MTQRTLPHFIIGGAPRSGTTWLYAALARHPNIFMAAPPTPEPKFFLVDELYAKGLAYYRDTWFPGVPENAVAGEKSTNYLESPVAARRIRECLPEVRLVFILREPVDRAFNNWLWSRTNQVETEDFATAMALETQREAQVPKRFLYARPHALFSRGLYADLLAPWFQLFRPEQILCLKYETLGEDPQGLLAKLHQFLGVEQRRYDASGLGVINKANGEDSLTIPEALRRKLEADYAEPNRRLTELLPDFPVWGN